MSGWVQRASREIRNDATKHLCPAGETRASAIDHLAAALQDLPDAGREQLILPVDVVVEVPRDVRCAEAMHVLHVHAELGGSVAPRAKQRYSGIAAHLRACGPCVENF